MEVAVPGRSMSVPPSAVPFRLSSDGAVQHDLETPDIFDALVAVGAPYLHVTSHRNSPCFTMAFSYSDLH
jgi:hypothetical protein